MKIRIYRLDEIAHRFGREALKAKAKGDKGTIDMFAAGLVSDATRPEPSARPGRGALSQLSLFDAGSASGSAPAATVHRRVARSHRRAAEAALTSGAGPGTLDLFAAHTHAATAHERAAEHVEAGTPGHEAHSHDVVAHTHAVLAEPHTAVHAPPGDLTHGGRLHTEFRIDKAGHQTRRWVAQHEAPKADEPAEASPVAPADQHIERVADDHIAELAATNAKKDRAEDRAAAPAPSSLHVSPGAPLVGQAMTLYAGRHTMKGHAIWTAKKTEHVATDIYNARVADAKRLGGFYSTYAKGGAIPGFIFKTEESALAFMRIHGGIDPNDAAQAEPAASSGDLPIPASDPVGTAAYLGALPTGARVDVHSPESIPRNRTLVKKAAGLVDAAAPKGSEPESPEDVAEALAADMATIVDGPPAMPAQTGEPAPNPPPPPSDDVEKRPEAELRSDEPREPVPAPPDDPGQPPAVDDPAIIRDIADAIAWRPRSELTPGHVENLNKLAVKTLELLRDRIAIDWTQPHRDAVRASMRTGLRNLFRASSVPAAQWEAARDRVMALAEQRFADGIPAPATQSDEPHDPSHGGKLTARKIIGRDGVLRTYWIASDIHEQVMQASPDLAKFAKANGLDNFRLVFDSKMSDFMVEAHLRGDAWAEAYFIDPAVAEYLNASVAAQVHEAHRPVKEPEAPAPAKERPAATPAPAFTTHDTATGKTTWAGVVTPVLAPAGTRADTQADLDALPVHTVLADRPNSDGRDPREWVKRPDGAGWSILIRGSGSVPDRHTSTPIPSDMLTGKLESPAAATPAPPAQPDLMGAGRAAVEAVLPGIAATFHDGEWWSTAQRRATVKTAVMDHIWTHSEVDERDLEPMATRAVAEAMGDKFVASVAAKLPKLGETGPAYREAMARVFQMLDNADAAPFKQLEGIARDAVDRAVARVAAPPTAPAPAVPTPPPPSTPRAREAAMGKDASKGERTKANDKALAIVAAAEAEGRGLNEAEQKAVAAYSGKGGIGDSLNQYFTRPDIARAMWALLAHHGVAAGARVLEPACGSGVFIETAPQGHKVTGVEIDPDVAGIARALHEPNGHEIHAASLESFSVSRLGAPDHQGFDVVIGNAPFCTRTGGGIRVHKPQMANADAYFLDTALDHAAPGGMVAMIVHKGIMSNAEHEDFRARLSARAEIVDAFRLPVEAFEHADTTVTSDVILMRRRPAEVEGAILAGGQAVAEALGVHDPALVEGRWFDSRPDRVLGTVGADWRGSEIVQGTPADDIAGMLQDRGTGDRASGPASTVVTAEALQAAAQGSDAITRAREKGITAAKRPPAAKGETRVVAGVTYILTGDPPRWHKIDEVDDVAALLKHGDESLRRAGELATSLADYRRTLERGDHLIARGRRRQLEASMRKWVDEYGPPGQHAELSELAKRDPNILHLCAAVGRDGALSDILMADPVVASDESRVDKSDLESVAHHLAALSPGDPISPADVRAMWTGQGTDKEVAERLTGGGLYLDVGESGRPALVFADDYVTGNIYSLRDKERANVERLTGDDQERARGRLATVEARIAERWRSIDTVDAPITAAWIPLHVIEGYLNSTEGRYELFGEHTAKTITGPIKVIRENGLVGLEIPVTERYQSTYSGMKETHTVKTVWGIGGKYASLEPEALRAINRTLKGDEERQAAADQSAHFSAWVRGSAWRSELEEHYNRTFFGEVDKRFSSEPLAISGLATEYRDPKTGEMLPVKLHPYQNETIRWAAEQGGGVVALDVGLGKTFTAIALIRHLRETGKVKKPVIVVPMSVATNWAAEYATLHPGAKLLVIGETATVDAKGKRTVTKDKAADVARKCADAAANDYDAIIITRDKMVMIPLRESTVEAFESNEFQNQRAKQLEALSSTRGGGGASAAKKREKARAGFDKARAELQYGHEKGIVHWEDIGVDCVVVDEAHGYKNLQAVKTGRGGKKPKFLAGSGMSKRATDMEMKTHVVRTRRQPGESDADHAERTAEGAGDGVFLLTATPTKNSPLECFNMLRHCAPDVWQSRGIRSADEFVERYCQVEERMVLDTEGAAVLAPCVTGFKNLTELRDIMRTTIRTRTAKDVGLALPQAVEQSHLVEMSDTQTSAYERIRAEAEASRKDPNADKMSVFELMDKLRKASMDMTLLDPEAHPDEWRKSPKYIACADRAAAGAKNGGQVIFVDSNGSHERMAQLLVERGIPRNRIAILNADEADDAETRYQVSQAFRAGTLDVVIGNTAVMGEGVNLQDRTTDLHHLDLPWDPGSMQQRNGRGIRQGNKNAKVNVHHYLAKGSFDSYKFQTLKGKSAWLDKLNSGVDVASNDSDTGNMSDEEILISLSPDPEKTRAEFDSNKAKRLHEFNSAARIRSLRRLEKLQAGRGDLAKMVPGTKAHVELASRVEADMKALQRDGALPLAARAALESNRPVIANEAGHIFAQGAIIEAPHGSAPHEAGMWRVESVDPAKRQVKLSRFAGRRTGSDVWDLRDIKGWTSHDEAPDEDMERIRKTAAGVRDVSKHSQGYYDNPGTYGALHGIKEERANELHGRIHDAYKAAAAGDESHFPVFAADGSIELAKGTEVGGRRMVLPFGEDRAKLAVATRHDKSFRLAVAADHAFGHGTADALKREAKA